MHMQIRPEQFERAPRARTIVARAGLIALATWVSAHGAMAEGEDPDKARKELEAVNNDLSAQREKLREIEAEVASLKNDRAEINARLIATAERIKRLETAIIQTENRLEAQGAREAELRSELAGQRDVLAVLLAALQKLGTAAAGGDRVPGQRAGHGPQRHAARRRRAGPSPRHREPAS